MYLVDMNFNDVEKITAELVSAHRAHIQEEYLSGKFMFGGRKEPRTGGILLSQHASQHELQQVLDSDPYIKSGLVAYSIIEFVPVMASKEYERLLF